MLKDKEIRLKALLIYIMFLLVISISCNIYSIKMHEKTSEELSTLLSKNISYEKEIKQLKKEIEDLKERDNGVQGKNISN